MTDLRSECWCGRRMVRVPPEDVYQGRTKPCSAGARDGTCYRGRRYLGEQQKGDDHDHDLQAAP